MVGSLQGGSWVSAAARRQPLTGDLACGRSCAGVAGGRAACPGRHRLGPGRRAYLRSSSSGSAWTGGGIRRAGMRPEPFLGRCHCDGECVGRRACRPNLRSDSAMLRVRVLGAPGAAVIPRISREWLLSGVREMAAVPDRYAPRNWCRARPTSPAEAVGRAWRPQKHATVRQPDNGQAGIACGQRCARQAR
jgi:hypothetical protein